MHRKGSNCIGRGFLLSSSKLSNSQSTIYGYISTKGGDMYIKGIFTIFLIWGWKTHGIYIIKSRVSMNLRRKVLSIRNLGF